MPKLLTTLIVAMFLAATALTVAMTMSGPRVTATRIPSHTIAIAIEPEARDSFFGQIKAFAKQYGFNLTTNGDQSTPSGPHYVFELDRSDIQIFCGNTLRSYPIDPSAHTGAPPPEFDPLHFEVFFYNKNGSSLPASKAIDESARQFTTAMNKVRGIRISVRK